LFLILEAILMGIVCIDTLLWLFVRAPFLDWLALNGGMLIVFGLCVFALLLCMCLVKGHISLACQNETIWEATRRYRISYFQDVPLHINPFDLGIFKNIMEFLTMKSVQKEWDWPNPPGLDDLFVEKVVLGRAMGMNPANVVLPGVSNALRSGRESGFFEELKDDK
jgi:hypothetical protein